MPYCVRAQVHSPVFVSQWQGVGAKGVRSEDHFVAIGTTIYKLSVQQQHHGHYQISFHQYMGNTTSQDYSKNGNKNQSECSKGRKESKSSDVSCFCDYDFTSTLEKIAINILYGGINGRPSGNTSRSDIRIILGVNILQSFPWHPWMKFCFKNNQSKSLWNLILKREGAVIQ